VAISKSDIFAAADALTGNGQRVTLEAVRQITGGSYTKIGPLLNEWKQTAAESTAASTQREPAPPPITAQGAALVNELWAAALDLANNQITAQLDVERESLAIERTALEAERDALTDQLAEALRLVDSETAARELAEGRLLDLAAELDGAETRVTAAEHQQQMALVRAEEIERRANELRLELDRAHAEADHWRGLVKEPRTDDAQPKQPPEQPELLEVQPDPPKPKPAAATAKPKRRRTSQAKSTAETKPKPAAAPGTAKPKPPTDTKENN